MHKIYHSAPIGSLAKTPSWMFFYTKSEKNCLHHNAVVSKVGDSKLGLVIALHGFPFSALGASSNLRRSRMSSESATQTCSSFSVSNRSFHDGKDPYLTLWSMSSVRNVRSSFNLGYLVEISESMFLLSASLSSRRLKHVSVWR